MSRRSPINRTVIAVLLMAVAGLLWVGAAGARAATVADDTAADFAAGAAGGTVVRAPGTVELPPTLEDSFDGTSLPAPWTSNPWPSAGTATVAGSKLAVNGARADSTVAGGPGSVLDFKATFAPESFQHIGFGFRLDPDVAGEPWALFTTGLTSDKKLYVWTNAPGPGGVTEEEVVGVDATASHDYRIKWTTTGFEYFVDGALAPVATHSTPIAGGMRAQASDFANSGDALSVDSFKLTGIAGGTYTSRVLDGGATPSALSLAGTSTTPAGTSVAFETRTGNTPTPDGSWSGYQAVGAGGTVASPARRYLQYRATLSTTDVTKTPALNRVEVAFQPIPPSTPAPPSGGPAKDTTAPRVTLKAKRVRATKGRKLALRLSCPSGEARCAVDLRLRRGGSTVAHKALTIPGGASRTLSLTLPKSTFRTLVRRGSLKIEASIAARDATGNAATARFTVRLLAPRR